MSYDLEARRPSHAHSSSGAAVVTAPVAPDLAALLDRARALVPSLPPARVRPSHDGLCADGQGFVLAPSSRAGGGVCLSAGPARGPDDERWMEVCAWLLAGDDGEVIDRHTGRHWPARLLGEWVAVDGLLSGRALAINEERIARRGATAGATGFAARIDALTAHVARECSAALSQRVRDELAYYATRPALVWPVARGLARVGDFSRLEALARGDGESAHAALLVAAEYGAAAVPFFRRALDDTDPNHRRAAARALHRLADPAVLPLVQRALSDKRSTVREAVLEAGFDALLALAGARAVLGPLLAQLAASDPSSLVRRQCARFHSPE